MIFSSGIITIRKHFAGKAADWMCLIPRSNLVTYIKTFQIEGLFLNYEDKS